MATVRVRIPDDLKERMASHEDVDWNAVIREHIRDTLAEREERSLASAVAMSERLSAAIDPADVGEVNSAEDIRARRDRR